MVDLSCRVVELYNDGKKLPFRHINIDVPNSPSLVVGIDKCGFIDARSISPPGKEVNNFIKMFKLISSDEITKSLKIDHDGFNEILGQTVNCTSCRQRAEIMAQKLRRAGHATLYPLKFGSDGNISFHQDFLKSPKLLCSLFYGLRGKLSELASTIWINKKKVSGSRCIIHGSHIKNTPCDWKTLHGSMHPRVLGDFVTLDAEFILKYLKKYLSAWRFCYECCKKVISAFSLLMNEGDPTKFSGLTPGLSKKLRVCPKKKHIHFPTDIKDMEMLEHLVPPMPEKFDRDHFSMICGNPRHPENIKDAQSVVTSALGISLMCRFQDLEIVLREDVFICQLVYFMSLEAMNRQYQAIIVGIMGLSVIELEEENEVIKKQKKEQKKLKKKKQKERKLLIEDSKEDEVESVEDINGDLHEISIEDEVNSPLFSKKSNDADCSSIPDLSDSTSNNLLQLRDGFETSNITIEESSLSTGTINSRVSFESLAEEIKDDHLYSKFNSPNSNDNIFSKPISDDNDTIIDSLKTSKGWSFSTLEDLLEDSDSIDEDCFIPAEDVKKFQSQHDIAQRREELRKKLKTQFEEMCQINK